MNATQIYERIRHGIGQRINGTELLIDLVDSCPGKCPTCPVGTDPRRDGNRMSLDLFRRILDKAEKEFPGGIRKTQLYRWSDPLMHPDLHLFIAECVARGIRCSTSSFLQSTTCDFEAVAASGVTEFRVSFSGSDMRKYQTPATPERFMAKFEMLAKLDWHPNTERVMFIHKYKNNTHEIPLMERYARDHGFRPVAFPATFMVYDRIIEKSYTPEDMETISWLTETPEANIARHKRRPHADDYCLMQEKEVTLDSRGNMQLCQLMFPAKYRMGNFLDTPLKDLRKKVREHPMCKRCKPTGVGHYSLIFADPAIDPEPVLTADEKKYIEEYRLHDPIHWEEM